MSDEREIHVYATQADAVRANKPDALAGADGLQRAVDLAAASGAPICVHPGVYNATTTFPPITEMRATDD